VLLTKPDALWRICCFCLYLLHCQVSLYRRVE
jgi:hypothetical protein